MAYSFNLKMDRANMAFAMRSDVNASYKDLGAVCDAIRYLRAGTALKFIDRISNMEIPIPYKKHNKHMGARHELHGRKGAYPVKAAKEVRIALKNAIANAANNAMDGEEMVIVHACANKTMIMRRYPSKGSISWGRGMYGRSATMHSDIEYAKIEIGLAYADSKGLSENMKHFISNKGSISRIVERISKGAPSKPAKEAKKEKKQEKKEKAADKPVTEKKAEAGAKPQAQAQKKEEPAPAAKEKKAEPEKNAEAKEQK